MTLIRACVMLIPTALIMLFIFNMKTYWKSASLSVILHGTESVYRFNTYLEIIRIEENKTLHYTVMLKETQQ